MRLPIYIDSFIYRPNELTPLIYSRARNIVYCCLLTFLAVPIFSLIYYMLNDMSDAIAILSTLLFFLAALFVTKFTRMLNLASNIILITVFFALHWLMQRQGGLLSPPGYWVILIPILAIVLSGIRASLYWMALSFVTVFAYYYFHDNYTFLATPVSDIFLLQAISIISLLIIVYLLIFFFEIEKNKRLLTLQTFIEQQNITLSYIMQNINARKKIEHKLIQLAHYDHLTKLPNRITYKILLAKKMEEAKKNNKKLYLLYLDIDNFKNINNAFGYDIGDLYLKEIADQFRHMLRKGDILCRLTGDKFIFIFDKITNNNEAITLAKKLNLILNEPITINQYQLNSASSIGIAIYPDHGDNLVTLTKSVDIAMYHSKAKGKNTYRFYNDELHQQIQKKLLYEKQLRHALKYNEFDVEYQPLYDIQTHQIASIEALIRWNSSTLGLVTPEEFIPIAEKIGMITILGEWILRKACLQFKEWQREKLVAENTKISINLSIIQMEQIDFLKNISDILDEVDIDPTYVELELTESIIVTDPENIISILHKLEHLGVSVAIDDFGTGYSSFSRLKTYPLHVLKMDKSFLYNLTGNNKDIVASIIALAHSLDLKIVAEGVETEEQYHFLKANHCDYIQGFYLCPPYNTVTMTQHLTSLKNK